jgi:hypothetical protein
MVFQKESFKPGAAYDEVEHGCIRSLRCCSHAPFL